MTRADVVRVARSYIDTPFHHLGRKPGVGIDCVGMPVCIARELGTVPAYFDVEPYTPTPDGVTMLKWCRENLRPVARADLAPGVMIVVSAEQDPQHIAIVGDYRSGGLSVIHASNSSHPPRVIETRLMFSRSFRYVAAFDLPGIQ